LKDVGILVRIILKWNLKTGYKAGDRIRLAGHQKANGKQQSDFGFHK
jgi:hypothetical protein